MDRKRNRNAIRSKKLIRQAFIELLREAPLEKITVTNLVERADVNRSTFYAHYPDVMGIIEEIEQEIIDYTVNALSEMNFDGFWDEPKRYIEYMIYLLEENEELYRLLSNSNVAVHRLEHVKDVLVEKMLNMMEQYDKGHKREEYVFLIRFLAGGLMEIYTQWIGENIDASLEEVAEKLTKLVVAVSKEL